MTIIPSCANKRYTAIDELVNEMHRQDAWSQNGQNLLPEDLGAELLCKFWDLLKEHPQFDLEGAIQDQLNVVIPEESCVRAVCTCGKYANYEGDRNCNVQEVLREVCTDKQPIVGTHYQQITDMRCEISRSAGSSSPGLTPKRSKSNAYPATLQKPPTPHFCGVGKVPQKTSQACIKKPNEPITEALYDIKMAQKHDSNCAWRLSDLMQKEDRICQYIHRLEAKEILSVKQLQQADTMWTNMERAYLSKLHESKEKHDRLLSQEMEIRQSLSKWRKKEKARSRRRKEVQTNICNIEEQARMKQKQLEKLTNECDCLSQQIDSAKKELEQLHENSTKKMNIFQKAQKEITSEISSLERRIEVEKLKREEQGVRGRGTVEGARGHLVTACRVLLQSQLDQEHLNSEEKALDLEMNMINESISRCKDQCQLKMKPLLDEIIAVENDITRNNLKCVRCNVCVSTSDIKKRCVDCPRCIKGTCHYKDEACSSDVCGCVCPDVKERFVENILDNMYSILESDIKENGSHLASDVLKCLKKSKSGRLDSPTRHKIHNYVSYAVGEDLDAIISGAGEKTKCEIEPKNLKQLKLCLNEIVVGRLHEKPSVKTKNMRERKDCQTEIILNIMAQTCSCKRWGSGCNAPCTCPGGVEACACWQRDPPRGYSTHVGISRSGILKKTSHPTPKAHSCMAGSGGVSTNPSRVSFSSARKVCISKKSVCACSVSAREQCKCSRSRSKSSITRGSSNAQYTACVRDKLIKDVTNVASKSPSAHTPICPYSSGSCTCIEEKELKLHRPSSRGSRTSRSSGAKLLSRPDVAVVPCPAKRKPSLTVCDPPQDMSGSGFFKRFSAASIRQASEKELREGGAGRRRGKGKDANGASRKGRKGKDGDSTGGADGAGANGAGAGGAAADRALAGGANGALGGATADSLRGDGTGSAEEGGKGGSGAEIAGAGVKGADGAGVKGADGVGVKGVDSTGVKGADGAGIKGADSTGVKGAYAAGVKGADDPGAGAGGAGAGRAGTGAGNAGGAKGAGMGGNTGGAAIGGANAHKSGAGRIGLLSSGAGAGGADAASNKLRVKRNTSKMLEPALLNAGLKNNLDGKESPGKTDSGICSRNSSPCKSPPGRSSPEPSIPVCNPRECTGPCSPSHRMSGIDGWSKADNVKLWRPQTKYMKPPMKDSSANTDYTGSFANDPCFRSYKRKLLRAAREGRKKKLISCNCCPVHLRTQPNVAWEYRQRYKDAVMEPQLPSFLKQYHLPKRVCF